jgi:hypothetical protein
MSEVSENENFQLQTEILCGNPRYYGYAGIASATYMAAVQ